MRTDNYIAHIERRESEGREQESRARRAAKPASLPGEADAAAQRDSAQARLSLALEIQGLEREVTSKNIEVRQVRAIVELGAWQHKPALQGKQAELAALESRLGVLHARKNALAPVSP